MLTYGGHCIDEADVEAVTSVLRSPRLTQGPEVERFECALAELFGAEAVCAVSNGTAALHLAYASLGLGPGDEIITSPLTFVATANAARMLGAEVRFGDVDPQTGNLDPQTIAPLINERTVGIVPVHFGGQPAALKAIGDIAQARGLWVVDDAAHALGATYQDQPIGGQTNCAATTFSFHPVKHITTGEGGAIALADASLLPRLKALREHGLVRGQTPDSCGYFTYEQHCVGYNYRLSDLQAALGTSQLRKLPQWVRHRRMLADVYREALSPIEGVQLPSESDDGQSSYHLMAVQIAFEALGVERSTVRKRLASQGIAPQIHYFPVCDQPYYLKRYGRVDCPKARAFFDSELSLPMFASMTADQVWQVADALRAALCSSCSATPLREIQT